VSTDRDVRELVVAGIDAFTDKVRAIPDDRWDAPTPCTEWTVRDLVNHMTYEHVWAPHVLRGDTMAQVGDRYEGDLLGDDPVRSWQRAADESRSLWAPADPDASVHVSSGTTPLREYAEQMYLDLVVHGWDLAKGAGLDAGIDEATAERELRYVGPRRGGWPGLFAAPVETSSGDPGEQLVARLGRAPDWRV
jgi:uncharacterized protein (TIGR03086 family)